MKFYSRVEFQFKVTNVNNMADTFDSDIQARDFKRKLNKKSKSCNYKKRFSFCVIVWSYKTSIARPFCSQKPITSGSYHENS